MPVDGWCGHAGFLSSSTLSLCLTTVTFRLIRFFFQGHVYYFRKKNVHLSKSVEAGLYKYQVSMIFTDVRCACMNIWFYLKSECTKRKAVRDCVVHIGLCLKAVAVEWCPLCCFRLREWQNSKCLVQCLSSLKQSSVQGVPTKGKEKKTTSVYSRNKKACFLI